MSSISGNRGARIFSQTTEYAIRALIEIATRAEGKHVLAAELAEALDIPQHYLSKILQQLVRTRVLKSVRGRQGGFKLSKPAGSIHLRELVEPKALPKPEGVEGWAGLPSTV